MKKLINKVRQWRVVGYGIIIASLYQNHDPQLATIEAFLLVILGESSARGVKTHSPKEYMQENLGTDSSLQSNPSSIKTNLGTSNNSDSIKKRKQPRTSNDKHSRTRITSRTK